MPYPPERSPSLLSGFYTKEQMSMACSKTPTRANPNARSANKITGPIPSSGPSTSETLDSRSDQNAQEPLSLISNLSLEPSRGRQTETSTSSSPSPEPSSDAQTESSTQESAPEQPEPSIQPKHKTVQQLLSENGFKSSTVFMTWLNLNPKNPTHRARARNFLRTFRDQAQKKWEKEQVAKTAKAKAGLQQTMSAKDIALAFAWHNAKDHMNYRMINYFRGREYRVKGLPDTFDLEDIPVCQVCQAKGVDDRRKNDPKWVHVLKTAGKEGAVDF